jgi:hypothetical protein
MALGLRANIYDNEYIVRDVLIRIKPSAMELIRSPHGITFFEKKVIKKAFSLTRRDRHRGSLRRP